jgi:hypothetical protein
MLIVFCWRYFYLCYVKIGSCSLYANHSYKWQFIMPYFKIHRIKFVASKVLFKKSCINVLAHYAVVIRQLLLSLSIRIKRESRVDNTSFRPSVCDVESATKPRVGFSWNSAQIFKHNKHNISLFPLLSTELNKVLYRIFPRNTYYEVVIGLVKSRAVKGAFSMADGNIFPAYYKCFLQYA